MKSMMTNPMRDPAQSNQADERASALSALLDGELDDQAARPILQRLSRDGAERGQFREYCAIGDALRGLDRDMPGLTHRVMAALEDEPTVLAPMRKASGRRPALWLAAATVAAITWGLWNTGPREAALVPLAATQRATPAGAGTESGNAMPYLAAHQDFTQAVVSPPEMQFTKITLAGAER
jgi:sigma-E factor negative regulatory protein RseA